MSDAILNTLLVGNSLNAQIATNVKGMAQIPMLIAHKFTEIVLFSSKALVTSMAAGDKVQMITVYNEMLKEQTASTAQRYLVVLYLPRVPDEA